ncbi:DUF4065 domain-containing protein [Sphingomonas sp. UV9]|uniref:Panacea domain-containing protein n=1 Tax=Sphingomonas sp. UV9 TaxID=1851410 RepID=UPI000FFBB517|nr:Panacea domain-containing protein [Sphingomonas sp. UV9]RXD04909.1 DUF4065 domain-containing protein [Sphingomonas sp. UV9]
MRVALSRIRAGFMICSSLSFRVMDMPVRNTPFDQDELYNPRKAAQLIAYFALREGGRAIEVLKAVKLAYLADRESLRRWGTPILHEPRASLPLGPVNRTTLDYIDGKHVDPSGWNSTLLPREKKVIRLQPTFVAEDIDEFSDGEVDLLNDVWRKFGSYKSFPLAIWTHKASNVPEWKDPNGSSKPIELIDILRAVGFPNPDAAIERIEEQRVIERTFRNLECQG